ncbi:polyhydroxyalkanoate biosynthesis repressor PhaR [Neobacillus sp. KR4-4]|uniref:polyhydroxyalkanoate biosynthesis repressor PhaR n=1 Tax=Neobacillus sp. KR4-4 TaxID=3344872 RepID=UPI0035CA06B1
MSKEKIYDPLQGFRRISEMWERQLNGMLYMITNNNEFVRLLSVGTDSHARYMERLRKNQELMAGVMNIPTKKDIANVAKLSLQTEEKIDILEEQVWNLQDSLEFLSTGNVAMFQDMVTIIKQIKEESAFIQTEFQNLRQEISQLTDIKQELAALKKLVLPVQIKNRDNELVLTGTGSEDGRG